MRIKNYSIRIKAGRYDSVWYLSDLVPLKGMIDHFARKENTTLSLKEPTTLLNLIPDYILLASYNSGLAAVLVYGTLTLRRFLYGT